MACSPARALRVTVSPAVFARPDVGYTIDYTVSAGSISHHFTQAVLGKNDLVPREADSRTHEEQVADTVTYPSQIYMDGWSDIVSGQVLTVRTSQTSASAAQFREGNLVSIEAVDAGTMLVESTASNGSPTISDSGLCLDSGFPAWCLVETGNVNTIGVALSGYWTYRVCMTSLSTDGIPCDDTTTPPPPPVPGNPAFPTLCRREFITALLPVDTEQGSSRMVAGTRSRLYVTTGDGNWQIIGILPRLCVDQLDHPLEEAKVPTGRFRVVSIGNMIFAAHSEADCYTWSPNSVMYLTPDGLWQSMEPVDDLIALGIEQVRAVCSSNGFILIGNVVEDGLRRPGLLTWSDKDSPRYFKPGPNSLAGQFDFGPGEEILAIVSFAKGIRVFTRQSIWAGAIVATEEVWHFERIHSAHEDVRGDVLAYPNSIVQIEDNLLFMGQRNIMVLGPTDRAPRVIDWIDQSSVVIYKGVQARWVQGLPSGILEPFGPIDGDSAHAAVAGFFAQENIAIFSWPSAAAAGVPDMTLAINMGSGAACLMDFGFTASACESGLLRKTLRGWMGDEGFCLPKPEINEGNPLPMTLDFVQQHYPYIVHPSEGVGKFPDFDLRDPGNKLIPRTNLKDFAPLGWWAHKQETGGCCIDCPDRSATLATVVALASDKCLKVVSTETFVRELVIVRDFCAWGQETGKLVNSVYVPNVSSITSHPTTILDLVNKPNPSLVDVQFASLWQSDTLDMATPLTKTMGAIAVSYESWPQSYPHGIVSDTVYLGVDTTLPWYCEAQVGSGYNSGCMQWANDEPVQIVCRVEDISRGTVPDYDGGIEPMVFQFNEHGRFVAIRLFCGGRRDVNPVGPFTIAGITTSAGAASARWH